MQHIQYGRRPEARRGGSGPHGHELRPAADPWNIDACQKIYDLKNANDRNR